MIHKVFCMMAVTLMGCYSDAAAARREILVNLSWESPVDLDLLIDEQPAYRQGGTPDAQTAGGEAFTISCGEGEYVIAVQNLSGHGTARPRIEIIGATENTGEFVLLASQDPIVLYGSVAPNAKQDCWIACSVDAVKGTITRIDQWE